MDISEIKNITFVSDNHLIENGNVVIETGHSNYVDFEIKDGKVEGKVINYTNNMTEIFYLKNGVYHGLYTKYRFNEIIKKQVFVGGELIETIIDKTEYDDDYLPF